jgi:hypothetical protein
MLAFIERLTLDPEDIGPEDIAPLRKAGIDDDAIEDAINICVLFNVIDRLADALGWDVPAEPDFWRKNARFLLKSGYDKGKKPQPLESQ